MQLTVRSFDQAIMRRGCDHSNHQGVWMSEAKKGGMQLGSDRRQHYIMSATESLKSVASPRELYNALYGNDPSIIELQRFRNRINGRRSNPGADLLGQCVEVLPELHNMTLAEFFGIHEDTLSKNKDTV